MAMEGWSACVLFTILAANIVSSGGHRHASSASSTVMSNKPVMSAKVVSCTG